MANPLISVRMPQQLITQAEDISQAEGFSSIQELIRTAVRDFLEEKRKQRAIQGLSELYGSLKGQSAPTKQQRNQIANAFLNALEDDNA